ncbi:MAG: amidohydrolase family protein [Xanthomonadaceae bacterium]|nr:amidohydrolase family protein [Xanthomonadaceae bacterium]
MIRGRNEHGAGVGWVEDSVGTLKAGYRADFVLLDNDPLGVAPRVIADLHVLSTWVDGEAVYSAPER